MAESVVTAQVDAAAGQSSLDQPVDYQDLKAWIEQQEIDPKPLTPLQQRAIADLRRSMEPGIGDRDWVTILNLFLQANRGTVEFSKDDLAPNGGWASQCTIKLPIADGLEQPLVFPGPGVGFVPTAAGDSNTNTVAPGFRRKKDAKQYAAKCCVEWLVARRYMASIPADTERTKFSKAMKSKSIATIPTSTPTASPASQPAAAAPASPKNQHHDIADDDHIPATFRVETLCRTLGITTPRYRITPSEAASLLFFDGHPDFGVHAFKVPEDLGRVANVYGRENARERIAEEVLYWLMKEEKKRGEDLEALEREMEG